ncbi:hypothetical protein ACFY8V_00475 [Streptomyces californicus]|uniref:hypothetical protein n=1 Tax=Streptomyces TaxID=1883 RepID=UPI0027DA8216|nr:MULTISPECIES: hypothetical protein [unclassified Streptomyces]
MGSLPAWLAFVASVSLLATGCGKTGCGSGAKSGEDAVRQFLSAAARDGSDEDVCRYLQDGESIDDAVTWVSGLGTTGDIDALDVREVRGDQMGAEHRFVLGPSSAPVADLAVIEHDGRFVVSVTGSTKK